MYPADGVTTWLDPLGERGFASEMAAFVEAMRRGGPSPVPAPTASRRCARRSPRWSRSAPGEPST